MLKETYQLLKKLEKEIPFKATIVIILQEDCLRIQILFRKQKNPYFFYQDFLQEEIEDNNEEFLIHIFIQELKRFYNNAKPENLEKRELQEQFIIKNQKKEKTNE